MSVQSRKVTAEAALISIVFLVVALLFLFPHNRYIPLDRRIAGLLGAAFCMVITWSFEGAYHPNSDSEVTPEDRVPISQDPGKFIDVPVLLILISIMIINFVIMRQKTVLREITRLQNCIRNDMDRAFWFVCLAAFVTSPFITNDGLCLLIVDPVLDAFLIPAAPAASFSVKKYTLPYFEHLFGKGITPVRNENIYLELNRMDHKSNRFFFMLGIACSANIGSAMTFTGNPQNIIIAGYLQELMNGGMFFAMMIPPALISWFIMCYYINFMRLRTIANENAPKVAKNEAQQIGFLTKSLLLPLNDESMLLKDIEDPPVAIEQKPETAFYPVDINMNDDDDDAPLTQNVVTSKIAEEVGSYSWVAFPFFLVLIVLELVGVFSLVALYALVAIYIISSVILVNYYRGYPSHWPNGQIIARRERIQLIIKYVEDMFNDLDYNLIVIFSGLFIVAGSFVRTGIPGALWDGVAGGEKTAFKTGTSLFLISLYTIVASQLIGNVAVIIMASPEMVKLDADTQKFGWLILAWVSTVAGNFTLAGSAANIIVAEKAFRHGNKKEKSAEEKPIESRRPTPLNSEAEGAFRGKSTNSFSKSMSSLSQSQSGGATSQVVYHPDMIAESPVSAKLKITSYEHFKICGLLTLVCILLGTCILFAECKSLGYI